MREVTPAIGWFWRQHAPVILSTLGAGTFFAVLGPFGSDRLGWPAVWLLWTGLMTAGTLFAFVAVAVVERVRSGLSAWAWILLVTLLVSAGITGVLLALEGVSTGQFQPGGIPSKFFHAFVISAAMVTLAHFLEGRATVDEEPTTPAEPAFLKRIPARLSGGDLYAVSAEDHYLRVHTSRGDDLILLRLSDAVGELVPLDGMRVHRSWWVARAGVERVKRESDKLTLVLRNGVEVPVARANNRALKEAGWL